MKLLDAFLALALTLAVFASAATVLVEMLHFATQRRLKDFSNMLGTVFDKVLADVLTGKSADECAKLRAEFIAAVGTDSTLKTMAAGNTGVIPLAAQRLTLANGVSVEDALRRLSRSDLLTAALKQVDPAVLENTLRRLVDTYARAEQASTALFGSRARVLSYLCGVFLAVGVNIDVVHMLDVYIGNPDSTRQTIAQLEALQKDAKKADGATGPNANAATPSANFSDQVSGMIDSLQGLGSVGVPVGWTFYPYCTPADGRQIDKRCDARPTDKSAPAHNLGGWLAVQPAGQLVFWAFCVVVTGVLIGLGGPYWFDIATSLGNMRELLRDTATGKVSAAAQTPNGANEVDTRIKQIVAAAAATD